jgi:hypothetical protein
MRRNNYKKKKKQGREGEREKERHLNACISSFAVIVTAVFLSRAAAARHVKLQRGQRTNPNPNPNSNLNPNPNPNPNSP